MYDLTDDADTIVDVIDHVKLDDWNYDVKKCISLNLSCLVSSHRNVHPNSGAYFFLAFKHELDVSPFRSIILFFNLFFG